MARAIQTLKMEGRAVDAGSENTGPGREVKRVRVVWPQDLDQMPIVFASEALGQVGTYGEILLTIGYTSPPAFLAETEEELRAMFDQVTDVRVRPLARYALTRATLDRLIEALETTRNNYDRMREIDAQVDAEAEGEQDDGAET